MFQWNQQSKRGKKPQDAANSSWRSVAGMLLAKWLLPQCPLVRQCSAGMQEHSAGSNDSIPGAGDLCWCGSSRRACRNTVQAVLGIYGSYDENTRYSTT